MSERKMNDQNKRQSAPPVRDSLRPTDAHPESSTPAYLRPDDQKGVEVDLMAEAATESAVATAEVDAQVAAEAEKKMQYYEASQWQLMRRRFRKHKMAFWMMHVLVVLYVVCLNCEFFSPYDYEAIHADNVYQPPQVVRFSFSDGLYVHPFKMEQHPVTLERRYYVDYERRVPIRFFVRGFEYRLFGFIPTNMHLFGTQATRSLIGDDGNGGRLAATVSAAEGIGQRLTRVEVGNGDLFAARVKRNDVLRVVSPDGDARDYRILRVSNRHEMELTDALPTQPAAGSQFQIHRVERAFLLGTDGLGRDMLSRIISGGRISLLLGITGVLLSFILGITFGGISGYYGGWIDMLIQRSAEIIQSIPSIPIWLALGAAIPKGWSPLQVYFGMTLILACMGWTGLCRVVRGKLLALREEDYARAALLAGATERRIIFMHLIPNFTSHIIASLTLAIPGMILAETSLSFLGLGLRPPIVSWGVLLQQANNVEVVMSQPWLLLPAVMVVLAVLSFNFIGEGLRDAADPYSS
jgi:ABC-type dipeptide/oligopeptide/nickel transport system permease subunit